RSSLFLRLLFGSGFRLFAFFLLRSGLLAFLLGRRLFDLRFVADELEDRHLGGVTAARAELDDARVAARTLVESRTERVEQLGNQMIVGNDALHLTAIVHAVVFSDRDQALDLRPQLFGLRQRRNDPFLIDELGERVAEQRIS